MNEQELLREMESQNRWWTEKSIELEKGLIERDIYRKINEGINKREVTGIVGLRRVGKTTILKQIIKSLLDSGLDAKRILFLSFDGFKKSEKILKQVLDIYFRHMLETTPDKLVDKVFVFFDEVQKIEEWSEEIKSFYEKGYKIKFYVSGSSSMNILRGSGESLTGRINIHKVFPFSFREFLKLNGVDAGKTDIFKIKYPANSEAILALYSKYFRLGGFPELYSLPQQEIKAKLKTFVDLTFYRDIVNIFEVKRPDVLEGLFFSILKESGNIVNYNNLSNSLNTKFETVKSYIEHLSSSFLISQSRFFSRSRKAIEKNAKMYVSDHSFSNLAEIEEGLKAETIIYNHLRVLVESGEFDSISYWRDRKNEVDIALTIGKEVVPIEVKYKNQITQADLKGLLKFMDIYKLKEGILVTKDLFEEKQIGEKEILFVPVWLFLLAV